MDPRLGCLAEYVATLAELVALLESQRFHGGGVRTTWERAEQLLVHYRELEERSGLPTPEGVTELQALARRAAGLNAIASDLASGRADRTRTELGRCREAQSRLRPPVNDGAAGEFCDLAG